MLLSADQSQLVLLDWQSLSLKNLEQAANLHSRLRALQELARIFALPVCSAQLPQNIAGAWLAETLPDAQFVVPLATRETRLQFETAIYQQKAGDIPIRLLFGHAQEAVGAADVALVASGTATLEAALIKRPMVITYKIAKFSYWLMKRMAYLPYVGLPNVLCGRFVVPEFLQDQATPENLAAAMLQLYDDKENALEIEAAFTQLHLQLRQNTAEKAANAVIECLN